MAVVALCLVPGAVAAAAPAQPSGAAISLSKNIIQVGQRVFVTLTGWRARNVTLSVCGNLARRGSGDCNLAASQALKLINSPEVTELTVFEPPGTCPCVIRASSAAQDEVAFAPIEVVGWPVGPVVSPPNESPIGVAFDVRHQSGGLWATLRSTLGGPATYRVKVTVSNRVGEKLNALAVTGSVGKGHRDSATSINIPAPGPLEPGRSWSYERRVTVPAPVLNRLVWELTVSGAGVPVTTEVVTGRVAIGLVVIGIILAIDVVAMMYVFSARRIRRRRHGDGGGNVAGNPSATEMFPIPSPRRRSGNTSRFPLSPTFHRAGGDRCDDQTTTVAMPHEERGRGSQPDDPPRRLRGAHGRRARRQPAPGRLRAPQRPH